MIRRPPRSTQSRSSAASDVYKRQYQRRVHGKARITMKSSIFSISKCSRMLNSRKIFNVFHCTPSKSASDSNSSGQETSEKFGKRKCPATHSRRVPQSAPRSFKSKAKALACLETSADALLYAQACNFLQGLVRSETTHESQRLEKGEYLGRLEGIMGEMVKVEVKEDVMRGYLAMQSELIRNISYTEFAKLMGGVKSIITEMCISLIILYRYSAVSYTHLTLPTNREV
eukprot:TRINITY_DN1508_c0_g2_i4.p1 TRINITY_DN1508_c0_g2~~TRINITY_DN1508_c0_g2_i4.p1  ORF type:complete len:243 (-),score=45.70 TRINITY_DN1508_c0_g2_i4:67-753(-)